MRPFCSESSVYCLSFFGEESEVVSVGALGEVPCPEGWIHYVGRSENGWASRLRRFFHGNYSLHWHVDYLVDSPNFRLSAVGPVQWKARRECEAVEGVREYADNGMLAEGFGSSDCSSGCGSHAWVSSLAPGEFYEKLSRSAVPIQGWVEITDRVYKWHSL